MFDTRKQRVIGRLVSVQTDVATIELNKNVDNFVVNGFDDLHRFAQINSYVVIPFQNSFIVAEVLGVKETTRDKNASTNQKVTSENLLDVNLIGELKKVKLDYEFQFGISVYPALYSEVLYIRDVELDVIFNAKEVLIKDKFDETNTKKSTLSIGTSSVFPNYEVKVRIDNLFSKHLSVLGNTGSGKSCTISSILQSIFEKEDYAATGSTFIVFDTNGEYLPAFSEIKNKDIEILHLSPENKKETVENNVTKKKFHLPHWFLNFDEWALLLEASEKVQLPVLRMAINFGKLFASPKHKKNPYINHILAKCIEQTLLCDQSPVSKVQRIKSLLSKYGTDEINMQKTELQFNQYSAAVNQDGLTALIKTFTLDDPRIPNSSTVSNFTLESLEEFLDLAILYEESYGRTNVRNFCSSLQIRLQNLLTREEFHFLKEDAELEEYFFQLVGLERKEEEIFKKRQVIIIDLSMYSDEIIGVISSVICRIVFEGLQKANPRNVFPVHIVVEEAHRYISEFSNEDKFQAKKIFERIAKEGRKYGLSLIISSQRPSELSKTVLSQCSNFIIHRIMNPEDLSYIKRMTPYISEKILNELPYIPRQQALIFGNAVSIPMMFKVRQANPKPFSHDNDITDNWYKGTMPVIPIEFEFNTIPKEDSEVPPEAQLENPKPEVEKPITRFLGTEDVPDDLPF